MKFLTLITVLIPLGAQADFKIICGENRAKGLEHSEVAFIDISDEPMKVYLSGKEVAEERFGIKALDGDQWMVGVDKGDGKNVQKFVFDHASTSVEEYAVNERGSERKVGKVRKCDWKETPSK